MRKTINMHTTSIKSLLPPGEGQDEGKILYKEEFQDKHNQTGDYPMTTDTKTATTENTTPRNGAKQRVISNPNDVASLVLAQLNHVNGKKDELTIAIKGLADTTQQLVRAYAEHTRTIQQLSERVKVLEGEAEKK
jgi:glycerol-3-phosphate dehydrogenase